MQLSRLQWVGIVLGAFVIVTSFTLDHRNIMAGGMPRPFNWAIFGCGMAIGVLSYASAATSLLTQMFRQPLIARTTIGLVQQPIHSRFQQSGSHRQTVGRHFLAFITVVQQQGPLQQSFYLQGKLRLRPRRALAHLLAAPDQVCQAGLIVGLFQLAVAAQTVMH